ncbi:MAG: thioesterase family protein [Myxococcota bacterium]
MPGSTMLRYLEHMRWESAKDPDVNLATMFEDDHRMVVRAQQLEMEAAVGLEEDLEISLELGHIGHASMDMVHEVVRTADRKRMARAVVTAVHLNPAWRPHPIPDHVRALVPPRPRLMLVQPPAPREAPVAWSRSLTVVPSDLDLFRHVNHARYLDYFDDTRRMGAADRGFGAASDVAGGPLLRASLDYRRQTLGGDVVTISSWLLSETGDALGLEMRRDGEVLARCRLDVRAPRPRG